MRKIISPLYRFKVQKQLKKANNIKDIEKILANAKSEKICREELKKFLNTTNENIFVDTEKFSIRKKTESELLNEFFESTSQTIIDEEILELLLKKMISLRGVKKDVLKRSTSLDTWKRALNEHCLTIFDLPELSVDPNIEDDEYKKWCEDSIVNEIKNCDSYSTLNTIWRDLKEYIKTPRVWNSYIDKVLIFIEDNEAYKKDEIWLLKNEIPKNILNRDVFEKILECSDNAIQFIPEEPFEGEENREEYKNWAEKLIIDTLSKKEKLEESDIYKIPNYFRNEKIYFFFIEKGIRIGLRAFDIFNRTKKMCEDSIKNDYYGMNTNLVPALLDPKIYDEYSMQHDVGIVYYQKYYYQKWLDSFSEKEKQEYIEWYENLFIEEIRNADDNLINKIPKYFVTTNIMKALIDKAHINSVVEYISRYGKSSNYSEEQYEDVLLYACKRLFPNNINEEANPYFKDYFSCIEKKYITENVALEAIKFHPLYLDYLDFSEKDDNETVNILNTAYKRQLKKLGREELTAEEIQLMKKFSLHDKKFFHNLDLRLLDPEIVNSIGENNLEKIIRYSNLKNKILNQVENRKELLPLLGVSIKFLEEKIEFIEPVIERLLEIMPIKSKIYSEDKYYNIFEKISKIIKEKELTEEEKTIITYLMLNPKKMEEIDDFSDITNFCQNQNEILDKKMANSNITLMESKDILFQRIVGLDLKKVLNFVNVYGNDSEKLLEFYNSREIKSYSEKAEKEALEIIIKLKNILEEQDIDKIKNAYYEIVKLEDKDNSYKRYENDILLEKTLLRAYGRDFSRAVNDTKNEVVDETIEKNEFGEEYVVRKIKGNFNRMISVIDAYRKSEAEEENFYEKWNTSEMANTHALCFSNISNNFFGMALKEDKNIKNTSVIISVNGFSESGITAAAPYDLNSNSKFKMSTETGRKKRFYTFENLLNNACSLYTEINIEIQDINEEEYKKIQPASIICFDEINEESKKAAIELSRKLGRKIPIELIDRRELAKEADSKIQELFNEYKNEEKLKPEIIGEIINKFEQMKNSLSHSKWADEYVNEEDAIFNPKKLNKILEEAVEIAFNKIQAGDVEEGLNAINLIQKYIKEEREKNFLQIDNYNKYYITGIDCNIDYKIDEIQRKFSPNKNIIADSVYDSIEIIKSITEINPLSVSQERYAVKISKGANIIPMSFEQFRNKLDIEKIQESMKYIHHKGFYSNNKIYSEEYLSRILMFSNVIGDLEGLDDYNKDLLMKIGLYHACGNKLDFDGDYGEYSAKIAGEELDNDYCKEEINVIKATIELINLNHRKSFEKKDTKEEDIENIFKKYDLNVEQIENVKRFESYISDAIELDKMKILADKTNLSEDTKYFRMYRIKNDKSKSLIDISSEIHEKLAQKRLSVLGNCLIEQIFSKYSAYNKFFQVVDGPQLPDSDDTWYTKSSICIEKYLLSEYPVLERLLDAKDIQKENLIIENDFLENAKKIASERALSQIQKTYQEIISGYNEITKEEPDKEGEDNDELLF